MDQVLRDLERRARETGRADDEARLLVARLRAGLLDDERVALAARLGHAGAALVVVGAPAPARSHPWHGEVRAALARRLLQESDDAPAPPARIVELSGPGGTNDGRRFTVPPHDVLRAELEGADAWEVRARYGEGEQLLLLQAPRARFVDLADFWVELGLRHDWLYEWPEPFSWPAVARRLLDHEPSPVKSLVAPLEVACGQFGFAPDETVTALRRLLPVGPFTRALRLCEDWNEVIDLLETDDAYVIAAWSTSA